VEIPARSGRSGVSHAGKFYEKVRGPLAKFAKAAAGYTVDGAKRRSEARQLKRPEPKFPAIPKGCEFLWAWFLSLERGRGSNGFGPAPFSYADLTAWAARFGVDPTPGQSELLLLIDRAYLAEANRLQQAAREANKPPPSNRAPRR
jgi:hypothetical protein